MSAMNMTNLERRWGIGARLTLLTSTLVGLVLAVLVAGIGYSTSSLLEERATRHVEDDARAVVNMVGMFNQAVVSSVQRFSRIFTAEFSGGFTLDTGRTVDSGGRAVPVLKSGGAVLNGDFSVPDRFTARTGVPATIFVRSGDDFIRIATSVRKENGERAVGTALDHASPAYGPLVAGKPYQGLAQLFGKPVITAYQPLHDAAGRVIGALYVGVDISADMTALKDRIRALKVGQSGYFFVLDARPGKQYGTLLLHPAKEGQNILEARDGDGRAFIREMLQKGEGVIRYPWANSEKGERSAREKLVAFREFREWGWLVAGGSYTDEINSEFTQLRNLYAGAVAAALALVAAMLYFAIRRLVTLPLEDARQLAQQMATGDLTGRLQTRRHDEIGDLVTAMNGVSEGLSSVVRQVRDGCDLIATASGEIAAGNRDLSARTEQQAAAVEQTASSMEELTSTIRQNADHANEANRVAASATGLASQGGAMVARVVSTMEDISASSRRMSDIIGTIDGIAFQTNILALNAAVEAARAGEHGRGFAVVASEVRALAQRSASAAKDIKRLIGDSTSRMDEGGALATEAGAMMQQVMDGVSRVSCIIGEISAAGREQSDGIEQVSQAVAHIDQGTQQNAALVEQAAAAADSLAQQSTALLQSVQAFRLR